MTESAVKAATGESFGGLAWMVLGAVAVAVVVAPLLTKYLPISPMLAVVLAGAALAYFGSGSLRKAGQGAALYGVAAYAMAYLAPVLGRFTGGAANTQHPALA